MAGLCALVLEMEPLRNRGKDSGPRSQGGEACQSMEPACLGCQPNSVLILTSPLETNNRRLKRSCILVPTIQQIPSKYMLNE